MSKGPTVEERIGKQDGVAWLFPERVVADYAGGAMKKAAGDGKLWTSLQRVFDRSKTEIEILVEQKENEFQDEVIWLAHRLLSKGRYKVLSRLARDESEWERTREAAMALPDEEWNVPRNFKRKRRKGELRCRNRNDARDRDGRGASSDEGKRKEVDITGGSPGVRRQAGGRNRILQWVLFFINITSMATRLEQVCELGKSGEVMVIADPSLNKAGQASYSAQLANRGWDTVWSAPGAPYGKGKQGLNAGKGGVCIMARTGMGIREIPVPGQLEKWKSDARLVQASLPAEGQDYRLVGVYGNVSDADDREEMIANLFEWLRYTKDPVVVAGDFNTTSKESAGIQAFLQDGWADAHHGEEEPAGLLGPRRPGKLT